MSWLEVSNESYVSFPPQDEIKGLNMPATLSPGSQAIDHGHQGPLSE